MGDIEDAARRGAQAEQTLGAVIRLMLEPLSLEALLERALELVFSVPWLALESKGAIFIAEDGATLQLTAQRGLHSELLRACARVPFGHCLCGRAASTRKTVFTHCLDELHEIRYEGIVEHGHYCVPILAGKGSRLLGVINLYLAEGHQRQASDESFLDAVASALAGVIERKKMEDELIRARDTLQQTVHELQSANEELAQKSEGLRQQRDLIVELSTPVSLLFDGVLHVRVIGELDNARADVLMDRVLEQVGRTQAQIVLLDIGGLPTVDSYAAQHIEKLIGAIRLLGTRPILTGIRPAVAQVMVTAGLDFRTVETTGSLRDAIARSLEQT